MTDKNMPYRDLDLVLILTQRMRELEAADIYGIWDWDSDNFKPKLTMIEHEVDSKATHEAEESAEADANIEFLRQFAKPSLSSPPTPPYLTPRPSAYDIPPSDSIYAAKVSDLVQSVHSDRELDIANVLAQEFTLLRQSIDSLPRLIAEQMKQPIANKESENKDKEVLLGFLRLVDPTSAAYHDILRALEKMTYTSTR